MSSIYDFFSQILAYGEHHKTNFWYFSTLLIIDLFKGYITKILNLQAINPIF